MTDANDIDWRAIAVAAVATTVLEFVSGGALGIFGIAIFFSGGEGTLNAVLSPSGYLAGFVVSLFPVVIGTLFLARSVDHNQRQHALYFGIVLAGVALGFWFCTSKLEFKWHDLLYLLAIVPTAMITNHFSTNRQR